MEACTSSYELSVSLPVAILAETMAAAAIGYLLVYFMGVQARPRFNDVERLQSIWSKHMACPHDIDYTLLLEGPSDFNMIKRFAGGLNEVRDADEGAMIQTALETALRNIAAGREKTWHLSSFGAQWAEETAK